jgi:WD40 repeat protein
MIDFDPSAPLLASSSVDSSIDVWNLRTGKLMQGFQKQSGSVSAVAFSPDGKYLASATKTSAIRLLNISTEENRSLNAEDAAEKIRHIAFSRDGKLLAGGSEDGKIRIWDVETGNVETSFAAHTAKIQGLEFNPDGTLLASASEDATVKLWEVSDWHLKTTLIGHQSGVYEIAFSPDGMLLLSGSDDKTMRLWDVASGKEAMRPIDHGSPVWAVDFDNDGKTIASGSEDSTVQLWKLSGSGTAVTLRDHFVFRISDGPIWWLKFHTDSNEDSLGIASQDKTVRVLHMSKLESLFSNPKKLEDEAEEQGGLVIGQGPNGEPQIVPMASEDFVAK